MSAPEISVVVPTHDRADLLPRLLRSVLGQQDVDLEVVVVDDGSRDHTPQVLSRCTDPRLRVLRQEPAGGVAAARNAGTRAARGRWVAWCDDDDVWAPDKLALQLAALAATPGARWCNGGAAYVDSRLRLSRIDRCPAPASVAQAILRHNVVTGGGSGVLAERELVLELGAFDTSLSMYADWDMWARLAFAAPLAVVDLPLVGYVEHPGGMSQRGLHLALEELEALEASLGRLAATVGLPPQLDRRGLGHWIFRQQTNAGRRRDSLRLLRQLRRRDLVGVERAVAYGVVTSVVPGLLHRRSATFWRLDPDYVEYACGWLTEWDRRVVVGEPRVRRFARSGAAAPPSGRPRPT